MRGLAGRGDPGEHGVEARRRGHPQQFRDDQLADPLAVAVAADVDRVLDAGAICGALLVRRQRPEADDLAKFVGRDPTATMAAKAPLRSAIQRCWSSSDRGTRSNVAKVLETS